MWLRLEKEVKRFVLLEIQDVFTTNVYLSQTKTPPPPPSERRTIKCDVLLCKKNCWISERLYYEWLQHFARTTKPTTDEPILLILDNHASYISIRIALLSIPPPLSSAAIARISVLKPIEIQFLLRVFYLKTKSSMLSSSGVTRKITQNEQFYSCLRVTTMNKGISEFSAAVISPTKPEKNCRISLRTG